MEQILSEEDIRLLEEASKVSYSVGQQSKSCQAIFIHRAEKWRLALAATLHSPGGSPNRRPRSSFSAIGACRRFPCEESRTAPRQNDGEEEDPARSGREQASQ